MQLKFFAIFDHKVTAYLNPFLARTAGEAERMFQQACQDTNTQFSKTPEDFTLFEVATWDDQSASIVCLASPHPICKGLQVNSVKGGV